MSFDQKGAQLQRWIELLGMVTFARSNVCTRIGPKVVLREQWIGPTCFECCSGCVTTERKELPSWAMGHAAQSVYFDKFLFLKENGLDATATKPQLKVKPAKTARSSSGSVRTTQTNSVPQC